MACDRHNWRALLISVCILGLASTAGCLRSSMLRPAVEPVLEPQSSAEQGPSANERLIVPPSSSRFSVPTSVPRHPHNGSGSRRGFPCDPTDIGRDTRLIRAWADRSRWFFESQHDHPCSAGSRLGVDPQPDCDSLLRRARDCHDVISRCDGLTGGIARTRARRSIRHRSFACRVVDAVNRCGDPARQSARPPTT